MELLTFVYGIQKIQIHICFSQFEKEKNSRKFLHIRGAGDTFSISFLPFTLKPLSPGLRFSLPI